MVIYVHKKFRKRDVNRNPFLPQVSLLNNVNLELSEPAIIKVKYNQLLGENQKLKVQNNLLKESIKKIKHEIITFGSLEKDKEIEHFKLMKILNLSSHYTITDKLLDINEIDISIDLIVSDCKDYKENFKCIICLGVLRKPLTCEKCECSFCSNCIGNNLTSDVKCPHCRQKLQKKNSIILNNILNTISIACPFLCNESIRYQDIASHLTKCEKRLKTFRCETCETSLKAFGLNDIVVQQHEDMCQDTKVNCIFCDVLVERKNLPAHLDYCPKKAIKCLQCQTSYPMDSISDHTKYFCKISSFYKEIEGMILDLNIN